MTTRIAQIEAILESQTSIPFGTRATLAGIDQVTATAGKRGFVDFSTIATDQPFLRTHREAFKVTVSAASLANLETINNSMYTLKDDYTGGPTTTSLAPTGATILPWVKTGNMTDTVLATFDGKSQVIRLVESDGDNDSISYSLPSTLTEGEFECSVQVVTADHTGKLFGFHLDSTTGDSVYFIGTFIRFLTNMTVTDPAWYTITTGGYDADTWYKFRYVFGTDYARLYVNDVEVNRTPSSGHSCNAITFINKSTTSYIAEPSYTSFAKADYPYKLDVFEGKPWYDGTDWKCDFMIEGYWRVS